MTGKPTISFAASASASEDDLVLVHSSEVTPRAGERPFPAGEPASHRWRSGRTRVGTGFGP